LDKQISWIGNPNTALWTLVLLAVWQFGSPMLIFLAGLKQIPSSYYESASIDGANGIQQFTKITLPMLTPIIFFNLVMQIISGFMAFTESYIITQGGPFDRTLFYALYLFQQGFQFYNMGYACALAWVLLLIMGAFTAIIFKSSNYWVYSESKGE
jgi:multiple sugar transport system permease protein